MRKVSLRDLEIGDRLAVDIRIESSLPDVQYRVRIDQGTELKSKHINRLKEEGIRSVFVRDPDTADLNEHIHNEEIQETEQETVEQLRDTARRIKDDEYHRVPAEELSETIDNLIDVLTDSSASEAFTSMKSHGDYLAKHCFEVCKLTIYFALAYRDELMEMYRTEHSHSTKSWQVFLNELGIGTLLHDIGNWEIPIETLKKKNELTEIEWEAIEKHPRIGYDILEQIEDISHIARLPALLHHERFSGQGYPDGKRSTNIHLTGRIVALTDVYTALTSERPYRIELTPSRARQIMKHSQEGQLAFDPDLFEMFMDLVPPYPIGQDVVLSDGSKGVVSDLEEGFHHPTVRVIYEGSEKLDDYYEITANVEEGPNIVN
jgi:HD-GYP domain-containing protein (c-di-GMP phosphodiesterase class II)